ncbi:MAG: 50S ribosomal protein L6, partial [Acidobacteriota bacterium]|nr:50S ribosomal protein L6 [Acidobacteriota bacterium]
MSRVGKEPIPVPSGTKVAVADGVFVAEGPKGKVSERVVAGIGVEIEDGVVKVTRRSDGRTQRARHGLMRSLLANAVAGATEGFEKKLEINGVGYRAEVKGKKINLSL